MLVAKPMPLGNNRWRLRTDIYDPVTGKRRQPSTTFYGGKREALVAQQEWEIRHRGVDHTGTTVTFSSLATIVLDHIQPNVEEQTYDNHERHLRIYLLPAVGHLELRELTTSHFDELYHRLATTPQSTNRNRPLMASTIGKIHNTATLVLNEAVRKDWLAKNPAALARKPTHHAEDVTPPDTQSVIRLLEWLRVNEPTIATFIDTLAGVGCRPGELCAVRWSDVDLSAGVLHLDGTIKRGHERRRGMTKTKRSRKVSLDAATVRLLEKHRAEQGVISPAAYVFSDSTDGVVPWAPGSLAVKLIRCRESAGVEGVTMRGLRHYVATQLIAAGVDVRTVAGRLGHSNVAQTLNVYASFVPEKDREAAELLAAIRGASNE